MAANATLQVRLDGGAPQTGGVIANLLQAVQMTALDKAGWGIPATKWIIASFPPSFVLPAGWAEDADGRYYFQGSADPPPFSLQHWGDYFLVLEVLGRIVDKRTAIRVVSPSGFVDHARGEDTQFGGSRDGNTAGMKANLRKLDNGLPMVAVSPSIPVTVAGRRIMNLSSADFDDAGKCVLDPAEAGHADGATLVVRAGPGLGTEIDVSPDFNNDGAPYNPAYAWEIEIQRAGAYFKSFSKVFLDGDFVAPSLVSVASDGTASLIVRANKNIRIAPDAAGLTIEQDSGTPPTVTGVTMGNGTEEVTLSLSGTLNSSLNPVLVFAEGAIRNRSGVSLAGGDAAISIDKLVRNAQHRWNFRAGQVTHSTTISALNDQVALPEADMTQVTGAAQPTYTAVDADGNGRPSGTWDVAGTRDFMSSSPTSNDQAGYVIYGTIKLTSGGVADQEIISAATGGNDPNGGIHLAVTTSGGGTLYFNAGDTGASNGCSYVLPSPTTIMTFAVAVTATQRRMFVNAVLRDTEVDASNPEPITSIFLGRLNNADVWPGRFKLFDLQWASGFTDAEITAGDLQAEVTAYHAYAHAEFGVAL